MFGLRIVVPATSPEPPGSGEVVESPDSDEVDKRVDRIRAGLPPEAGLFPCDAEVRKLLRYEGIAAAGFLAALCHISHPPIAMGIWEHSEFETDPQKRLQGTVSYLAAMFYGDRDQVKSALKRWARSHRRVKGCLGPGADPDLRDPVPYGAADPVARAWVLYALIMAMIEVYPRISPHGEDIDWVRAWGDMVRVFEVSDIRRAHYPDDFETARARYRAAMAAIPTPAEAPYRLVHGKAARSVARAVFAASVTRGILGRSVARVTVPPSLQPLLPPGNAAVEGPIGRGLLAGTRLLARFGPTRWAYTDAYLDWRARCPSAPRAWGP